MSEQEKAASSSRSTFTPQLGKHLTTPMRENRCLWIGKVGRKVKVEVNWQVILRLLFRIPNATKQNTKVKMLRTEMET